MLTTLPGVNPLHDTVTTWPPRSPVATSTEALRPVRGATVDTVVPVPRSATKTRVAPSLVRARCQPAERGLVAQELGPEEVDDRRGGRRVGGGARRDEPDVVDAVEGEQALGPVEVVEHALGPLVGHLAVVGAVDQQRRWRLGELVLASAERRRACRTGRRRHRRGRLDNRSWR